MTLRLPQLETLLAAPDFWDADLFVLAEDVARDLQAADWESLRLDWPNKDEEWWSRFLVSLSEVDHEGAVQLALEILARPDRATAERGLATFQALAPTAGGHLGDGELEILEAAWRRFPDLRERIKQAAWEKGKSGALRRVLGLEWWGEALQGE